MRIRKLIIISLCSLCVLFAKAQDKTTAKEAAPEQNVKADTGKRQYTKDNPLVYEDLWDLAPYAFINSEGKPDGYNVELVKMMTEKLGIPVNIVLKATPGNFEDLQSGKADLTIGMKAFFHDQYGAYGNNVLTLFTHSVAFPRSKDPGIREFADLKHHRVIVHDNSFSHNLMVQDGMKDNAIPMRDMKAALMKINEDNEGAVLWNTMTIRYLIDKYKLTDLRISSVNMRYGEYHFMSKDSTLLQKLDSLYDEISTSEEVLALRQKWFYPAASPVSGMPQWLLNTLLLTIFLICSYLCYYFYYHYRERKARKDVQRQATQLSLLINSGNYRIWTYDVKEQQFNSITIEKSEYDNYNRKAFAAFFEPQDYAMMLSAIDDIAKKRAETKTMPVRCHDPRNINATYFFDLSISVLREEFGEPTVLLGVQTDKTLEKSKLNKTRDNLMRFRTIFNTAMAQIALYDGNGYMIDINDSACETFGIVDKKEFLESKMHISRVPVFHHMQHDIIDELWVSSIIDFDDLRRQNLISEYWTRKGIVYYEFTILPIYDAQGKLIFIVSAGRDITDVALQMNRERRRSKRIETASQEVSKYVENINNALEVSKTVLANYNIKTKTMEVTYDMNKPKLMLSQLQCVHMMKASQTRHIAGIMLNMDKKKTGKFKLRLDSRLLDKNRHNRQFELNAVPMSDNKGDISHYFCLCRDITELAETEKRLKEESEKAQEAEKVKNSFLMNMSYEIRTPLNTVVGFAELFNAPHDRDDEPTFIDEIKKNTDLLLKLVNNILLLSRIDAKMLELNPQPTDFGELFNAHCLIGLSRGVNENVETKVETRPDPLILEIDSAQTGFIIETLCMLSAKFTERGHIRTRYEYRNGLLTFVIEDTGMGFAQTTIERILDRTIDGLKGDYNVELQITICNELAKLLGGQMDIQSAEGRGTTVWVTIPCKDLLKELENN